MDPVEEVIEFEMRYVADDAGHLQAVSFGAEVACAGQNCIEYTGSVPEGYASLAAWYVAEYERLHKWIILNGNLAEVSDAPAPLECCPADHLVGVGRSGAWTWRKWSSGISEVWGSLDIEGVAMNSGYGSSYYTDYIDAPGDFPADVLHTTTSFQFGFASRAGTPGVVECAMGMAEDTIGAQSLRIVRPALPAGAGTVSGTLTWNYKGTWQQDDENVIQFIPVGAGGLITADGLIFAKRS